MIFRGLFLFSLILRLIFFFFFFDEAVWNIHMAFRFDERALSIMSGQASENLAAWGSYPLFLSVLYKVLDLAGLLAHRIAIVFWIHQFLGLLTAFLCFRFLTASGVSRLVSTLLIAVFFLFNPVQIYLNGMNISESLFQLTSLSVGLLAISPMRSSWLRWSLFAVCLAVSVMIRNIFIPFALLVVFVLPFLAPEGKKLLRQPPYWLGIAGAIFLIFLGGRINASFDSGQRSALSLNRGANLAQTWCEAPTLHFKTLETSFWFSPPALWPVEETKSLFLEKDFGDSSYYAKLAFDCLREDPSLLLLRSRSLLNVFNGPLYPDPLKGRMKPAQMIWGALSLALFLFSLIAFFVAKRSPAIWLWSLFVASQLAAVYGANTGESRFLYSFLPGLVILAGLLWSRTDMRPKLVALGAAFVSTALLWGIPPLHELMASRDHGRFFAKDPAERRRVVEKAIQESPRVPEASFCAEAYPEAASCWADEKADCGKGRVERIRKDFRASAGEAITEEKLFCTNLWMARLWDKKGIPFQAFEIQAPSPLPGGPGAGNHPIVAMAAQLLQAKLLERAGRSDLIPENERSEELLYILLRYQHRRERNRDEYKGAIVENPLKAETSERAAWVFQETLKLWLNFPPSD